MRHSKLIELLQTFSTARWRRFGEFLRSPYWNKNTDIEAFYQYLDRFYPAFEHPHLAKTEALPRLALSRPANEKSLAYLMSQTLALAENFLTAERLQHDAPPGELLLLAQLREAGLNRQFASAAERTRKKLAATARHDGLFFQYQFELSLLEYETLTDPKQLQFNELLQIANDRLDDFYLAQKLRLLAAMSNLERLLAIEYRAFLGPEIESALLPEAARWRADPVLAAWFHAWQINRYDHAEHFEALLGLLREHAEAFAPAEQKLLYIYASNFCTRRINHHNEHHFYAKYIDIHDILLEKGLLLENGELPPRIYMNLMYAGLRSGRVDWTRDFLHRWRDFLPRDVADNLHGYCLAQWHYFQKNYGQAQQALARVEFQDFLLAIGARSLQVKIFYETGQTELLFSALEANRLFLLRAKQIEPRLRRQMQQFIDFARRLAKIFPPDPAKLRALAERLPPATEVMHRDWLAEMMQKRTGK